MQIWVDAVFIIKVKATVRLLQEVQKVAKKPAFICICEAEAHLTLSIRDSLAIGLCGRV